MFKYHIFRVFDYKGGELCTTLNLDYESALAEYCSFIVDKIIDYMEDNDCKNFRITEKEVTNVIEDTFSIYAGGDHVVLEVYQSSNDGKLRRYDFPMNAIVDYVNMEINKYGSD